MPPLYGFSQYGIPGALGMPGLYGAGTEHRRQVMKRICERLHLFSADSEDVLRVPFLVKGRIVDPPQISRQAIEDAFNSVDQETVYTKLPHAQLLREPVIDRQSMRLTGDYVYQVLPALVPEDLIEQDTDRLLQGPYALPF